MATDLEVHVRPRGARRRVGRNGGRARAVTRGPVRRHARFGVTLVSTDRKKIFVAAAVLAMSCVGVRPPDVSATVVSETAFVGSGVARDPSGDVMRASPKGSREVSFGMDLRAVRATYDRQGSLNVTLRFWSLKKSNWLDLGMYVGVHQPDDSAGYMFEVAYTSDHPTLHRVKNDSYEAEIECAMRYRVRFSEDLIRVSIPARCLQAPAAVNIFVRVGGGLIGREYRGSWDDYLDGQFTVSG